MNLSIHNRPDQRAREIISKYDPDLIVMQELTPEWWTYLKANTSGYSCSFDAASSGYFGLGVLSKLPLRKPQLQEIMVNSPPLLQMAVQAPSNSYSSVNVVVLHTPTPKLIYVEEYVRYQQQLGKALHDIERKGPLLVIGDFNLTRFSRFYQELLQNTQLSNSEDGAGWQAGWPAELPSFMRVPIDHCWLSKNLKLINRELGPDFGSDHLPLFIEVGL